jgi:rhodanese-related sulfurtransferase
VRGRSEVSLLTTRAAYDASPMTHPFSADDVDLAPDEVQRRITHVDVQLVDVREPYEHEAGHIEGSRPLELERLASKAETLDRDRPVIFYCRLGARSGMAAHAFRSAGFEAHSMVGGLERWHAEGRPIVPEGGHVADH